MGALAGRPILAGPSGTPRTHISCCPEHLMFDLYLDTLATASFVWKAAGKHITLTLLQAKKSAVSIHAAVGVATGRVLAVTLVRRFIRIERNKTRSSFLKRQRNRAIINSLQVNTTGF